MKRQMIEAKHPKLSIAQQCQLLQLSRSAYYYQKRPESAENLSLMRIMDEQWLRTPFYGAKRMRVVLQRHGYQVNIKRLRRLMRTMGIEAIYPKPNLSKPGKRHKKYPYLMRDVDISAPNCAWCADITYIPMEKGFMYLVAIMDWHTRAVLSWELSNTLDAEFCISALKKAINEYGKPLVFNTDQGTQFNSDGWIQTLEGADIRISQDGKGRATDNAFIERLWRSLKYESIYLHSIEDGYELYDVIRKYFLFYNYERPHQGLSDATPMSIYQNIPYQRNALSNSILQPRAIA
jgi:putative transposase